MTSNDIGKTVRDKED